MCGGYDFKDVIFCLNIGSSPRVWGILIRCCFIPYILRFIPTCVGDTPPKLTKSPNCQVHPHVCGGYQLLFCIYTVYNGSSPRVWGIHYDLSFSLFLPRFIPTCVGDTPNFPLIQTTLSVHPHVCGGYGELTTIMVFLYGSSPRVWGIQNHQSERTMGERFIPTCVGDTQLLHQAKLGKPVHPHVCGGYLHR